MSFDQENGLVSAYGNVEITHGERTLLADKVTYNQNTDIVQAAGNITILEPSGEILFADQITITGDLKDGLVRNIGMILTDRSRLAAAGAKRSGAIVTELRKGVYTPCKQCTEDPDAPPLWQIKAVRVIHDKRNKTIEYRDAWLEVYGYPVLYTPYFIHPDPSIRRKAGFLAPGFGGSSDL
ncbi:MAG: LptA/OstA family protein, partial [Rhodospirillales bacterium]